MIIHLYFYTTKRHDYTNHNCEIELCPSLPHFSYALFPMYTIPVICQTGLEALRAIYD